MERLFGTDGIRGIAGRPPLDRETIYRVAFFLTRFLRRQQPSPRILIARDTRESGLWMEPIVAAAVRDSGGEPFRCGVLSTPAISFLTRHSGAQAGIMLSASHNPYQDNGIKIFSSSGMKFTDDVEKLLERQIVSQEADRSARSGSPADVPDPAPDTEARYRNTYLSFLRETAVPCLRLDGMRLVVDCGNGSASEMAPPFLRDLGAEVRAIHCEPNGRNINLESGALYPGSLCRAVPAAGADLGIAFDGDADRAIFVDHQGTIRDGDDVLYLLARNGALSGAPPVVVSTVMANLGLELALSELGVRLLRTPVGDRYVLEEMLRSGAVLGGEQSGHIILSRISPTGDGLLIALKVLETLVRAGISLAEACAPLVRLPQVLMSVPVREKVPLERVPGLAAVEAECRKRLGPRCRLLVRYSGTEKVARIMVEGEGDVEVRQAAARLASVFEPLGP